jgi:hypothetical protein
MTDRIRKDVIEEALEDFAHEKLDRAKSEMIVSPSVGDALRGEAGLEPISPGYTWDDPRSTEFWNKRLE